MTPQPHPRDGCTHAGTMDDSPHFMFSQNVRVWTCRVCHNEWIETTDGLYHESIWKSPLDDLAALVKEATQ